MNSYYSHIRHDVLAHVPQGARRVLSVGCGAGFTELELIKRGVQVTGLEMSREAAAVAQSNGLRVIVGDASAELLEAEGEHFDCLIYADVLEHIVDPEAVLRSNTRLLRKDGIIIISIPNFRYVDFLKQLVILGHVRYSDRGITDRTHLRITTRKMVEEWFGGLNITTIAVDYRLNRRRDIWLSHATVGLTREFFASQIIVVGIKP